MPSDEIEPISIYLLGWSPEEAIARGYVFDDYKHAREYGREVEEEEGGLFNIYELSFIPPPEALKEVGY